MADTAFQLPEALIQSMREQRVVLFVGAGASRDAAHPSGEKCPNGNELKHLLALKFFGKELDGHDLASTAEVAVHAHGESVVFDYIKDLLSQFTPSATHRKLPKFYWRLIATTNYDNLIDLAYSEDRDRLQTLVPFVKDTEPVEDRLRKSTNPLQYIKLHGCLNHTFDRDIPLVLSHESYSRYAKNRSRLFSRVQGLAYESTFVFVGYRLGDAHIRDIIYRLAEEGIKRPRYYIVDPYVGDIDTTYWMSKNVQALKTSFELFVDALDAHLPDQTRKIAIPKQALSHPIARHFKTNDDVSEALIDALAKDILHIHPGMPIEPQDAKKFYHGFDTGWGAIAQRLDVYRTQVDDVLYDAVLDAPIDRALKVFALVGAAGCGKTIAIKRAAWEAAADHDCLVLWQRENGALTFDTLAELHRRSDKRIFLFVDRAATQISDLENLCTAATLNQLPLTVVCAERLSDWNVYCDRFVQMWAPTEIPTGKLTTGEIEKLVDLLTRHSALGYLAGQTKEKQVLAFSEGAERHLLVALHEATLGKPFEQIVLDEYRAITPERARKLYLDICTMHQYGAPARAGTISRITGVQFAEYQDNFFKPLEDVVIVRRNPRTQDEHYHARHSRVAQLVFRQACPTDTSRVDQMCRIIEGLDIGFSSDTLVLEETTKGHQLAETLDRVASGRDLYRAAIEIAPQAAFLRQQHAIFESNHKHGSLEEADRLAREAIALDPRSKPLKHTHAVICRKRANAAKTSIAKEQFRRFARERLDEMRAETDNYVITLRLNLEVDELIDFSQELSDAPSEADVKFFQDKVRSTETMLTRAKQRYPDEPEIAKAEARLSASLSQDARAVRALERAWQGVPRGSSVAIRLARHYSEQDQPLRTLSMLQSALERNPDDRATHLELAKHYLSASNIASDLIARHFAKSYSPNDGNYEAQHLHAQFLFLQGRGSEAYALFSQIDERAPREFRRHAPKSKSIVSSKLSSYRGTMATVKATIGFIRTSAYPADVFVHANGARPEVWRTLRTGDAVKFEISFNRAGPVALNLEHV